MKVLQARLDAMALQIDPVRSFLSFPFLSFPFLSFPFLSFLFFFSFQFERDNLQEKPHESPNAKEWDMLTAEDWIRQNITHTLVRKLCILYPPASISKNQMIDSILFMSIQ